MLLDYLLRRVVKLGSLTLIDPKGRSYHYGEPANDSTVVVRLNGALTPWRIVLNPKLAVGEAFMDGRLVLERGSIRSEEHTSELQSLMRHSYAVFCLKHKKHHTKVIEMN